MNIYDVLNEINIIVKDGLSPEFYEEAMKDKLDTDYEKCLFDLLRNIASLGYEITETTIKFQPSIVLKNKRSFAIEDLSEEDYVLLSTLDLSKLPLKLRARLADIFWTQKKEYKAAQVAAEAYFELFNLHFSDEDWTDSLDIIKRAICISAQIRNKEFCNKCCQIVYDHIIRIDGEDKYFLSLSLIEIVLERIDENIDSILKILNKIIKNSNENVHKIEKAYDLKIKCLNIRKDRNAIKISKLDLAKYYVNRAEEVMNRSIQGTMEAERLLKKAVLIYRENGEKEEGEQAHKRLVEIQKQIPEMMVTKTISINMSNINSNIELNMKGLSFKECIIRMTQLITFYKKEDIKKQVIEERKNHPLLHLFGQNIVNSSGQTILTLPPLDWEQPEENEKIMDMHIFQKMYQLQNIAGDIAIKYALDYIRKTYDFELGDLNFLIENNAIIPHGRERIFCSVIYMALKGQYYEALHILAPQVENLFRNIAREVGGLTVTLEIDGTSKEKVISSIFDLPELKDCYDNDILFLFRGLLNEQAGANIRNRMAHGILDERASSSGICLYFICAVIKLLVYTSLKCYEIIANNEKLQSYINPEDEKINSNDISETSK